MRFRKWLALLSVLSLIFFPIGPPPAFGQFLGQVTIATVQAQLASNLACTGSAQNFITSAGITNFNNLGQTQHQASATSAAASFVMEIDGIDVLGNVVRISNPTIQFQPTNSITGYVAQGTGYYPNIQVTVTCTAAATFSMTYSGSTGGSGNSIIATPGTTPLINPVVAANVQGLVPRGFNGGSLYPVVVGALAPPTNLGLLRTAGIDTFSISNTVQVNGGITNAVPIFSPPQPSAGGETIFAFYGSIVSVGASTLAAPWTCIEATCGNSQDLDTAFLNNYTTNNPITINYVNSTLSFPVIVGVAFAKAPTVRQHVLAGINNVTFGVNTLAGSYVLTAFECLGTSTCTPSTVTDTQGNPYKLVAVAPANPNASGNVTETLYVYIGGPTSAAADRLTVTMAAGTFDSGEMLELSNPQAAPLNTQSVPMFQSNNKAVSNEDDNGGMFLNTAGFDYTQTTTLAAAGTTTFPLFAQAQHGIFFSCAVALRVTAASGTTPTLDTYFQDSGDNVGFNDRMHFPQATAVGNFLGAVSGGSGGITPVATTDGVLAASTKLDGPLSAFGRIKFVVGGTTPSFTVTYNVACR